MGTVKAIKYGMKGDEVSKLQTELNNYGYNLAVDGSFGPKTLAAVKDYQNNNGLAVDGMVGPQTSAKLFGASADNPAAAAPPSQSAASPGKSSPSAVPENLNTIPAAGNGSKNAPIVYPDMPAYDEYVSTPYVESEAVKQAGAALNAILEAQPGAYESKWQGQIDEIIGRILNREEFSYDVNEDALYQQYADQYTRGGKLAMADTMGQAAAMTGGYGNSYAATVGNQAYQAYLSQLNEVLPELYGMALDRHNAEGQEMYNQYGLLSDREALDYGRHMDEYNKWAAERDYATGRYDAVSDRDYEKWVGDRNFEYQVHTDAENREFDEYLTELGKLQWDAQFEEGVKQNTIGNEQWEKSFAASEEQRGIDNEYRETARRDDLNSEAKAYAREEAFAIIESGGIPSDELLAAAGLSKETVTALNNAYAKAASSGDVGSDRGSEGGTNYVTDSDKIGKWSEAILDAETEEEALRYVERLEQLDPELADSLYEEWLKSHASGHTVTDTTVALPSSSTTGTGGGKFVPNIKR